MAGPWFTVLEAESEEWTYVDDTWISNGDEHEKARVWVRAELERNE